MYSTYGALAKIIPSNTCDNQLKSLKYTDTVSMLAVYESDSGEAELPNPQKKSLEKNSLSAGTAS